VPIVLVAIFNMVYFFSYFVVSMKHILEVTEGEVDIGARWKWAFLSFQYFWVIAFIVILYIKLEADWEEMIEFGYTSCFIALEMAFLCRIGHDLVVIYKHLEPARLNPTFLDVVIV